MRNKDKIKPILKEYLKQISIAFIIFYIFRIGSILGFAYLHNQPWNLFFQNYIPVIEFQIDNNLFLLINSYALILTSVLIFILFLLVSSKTGISLESKSRTIAWYSANVIAFSPFFLFMTANGLKDANFNIILTSGVISFTLVIIASIVSVIKVNKRYSKLKA
ncbi:hypothetical protein KBD45_02175 [Candidatus Dojkabacteria bacterium]|nr:hypothetical protein [Candidatus Dojkabacteria bacterium]